VIPESRLTARADAEAARSFALRLDAYAASLPVHERAILAAMLEAAMPALDRLHERAPAEVLDEAELAALNALLAQGDEGA
jgi:hypothetical protein